MLKLYVLRHVSEEMDNSNRWEGYKVGVWSLSSRHRGRKWCQPSTEASASTATARRRGERLCRLTCTRQVPVQRRPTMDPSAFCGIFLGFRPITRRQSYSSRSTRRLVEVTAGFCCQLSVRLVALRHVFVVPGLRNSGCKVSWNWGEY